MVETDSVALADFHLVRGAAGFVLPPQPDRHTISASRTKYLMLALNLLKGAYDVLLGRNFSASARKVIVTKGIRQE